MRVLTVVCLFLSCCGALHAPQRLPVSGLPVHLEENTTESLEALDLVLQLTFKLFLGRYGGSPVEAILFPTAPVFVTSGLILCKDLSLETFQSMAWCHGVVRRDANGTFQLHYRKHECINQSAAAHELLHLLSYQALGTWDVHHQNPELFRARYSIETIIFGLGCIRSPPDLMTSYPPR